MRLSPLLRTGFALFAVVGALAQPAPRATPPPKSDAPLTRASFTAKGLNNEEDLNDLFVGNFSAVAFDRGSLAFTSLFEAYLEAFSAQCSAFLPPHPVEMTTMVCAEEPAPFRLPSDPPPQPHPCATWKKMSLGFADPALYAVKNKLDADQAANQAKDTLRMASSLRPAIDSFHAKTDMELLVRINACGGPGLRRFQDNLALFAGGKPPLLLPGAPPVTPTIQPPGVLVDSDFNRLLEDLIVDQARTWAMNRYVPGSLSQVIVAHDPTGRPSMIRAKYVFTSPMKAGRNQGSVNVSFADAIPQCIYFFDAPNTCQPPNRRIVAKYSSGGYVDPNILASASSPSAAPAPLPPSRDPAIQEKARAEASLQGNICVPDDLLAEWRNPPAGGKMEALQRLLKASLRERATLRGFDQTKWMTIYSKGYSTWTPTSQFRGVVAATDGGSCTGGHHEVLPLAP